MKYIAALLLMVSGTLSAQIVVLNAGDLVSNDRTTINNNFAYLNSFAGVVASLGYTPLNSGSSSATQLLYNSSGSVVGAGGITTPDGINLLSGSLGVNGPLDTQVAGTQLTVNGNASITNNNGLLFDVPPSCGTGCSAGPFSVYSNSEVFNGTTDNVLDVGYNIVPGSNVPNTVPVNNSEAYFKWNWEANYNQYNNGTNTFEWNSNYWNAGGTMYVRPHNLSINRTTLAVNWQFNGTVTLPDTLQLTGTVLLNNNLPLQSLNQAASGNIALIQANTSNQVWVDPGGAGTILGSFEVLPNNANLYSRNAANTANNSLIYQDTSNNVQIAGSSQNTYLDGNVYLSGAFTNLNNNENLTSWNAANNARQSLIYQDTSNNVQIAASGQATVFNGSANTFTGNVAAGGGANVVYRCVTAGASLPIGSLTINAAACGSTADAGFRSK